ncbi:MAG: histidinol dehydrogenase [Deltaproteobacteria bacterium]|nr:histidinol dehydrogenase [Deltaproteobacteria bacterium]
MLKIVRQGEPAFDQTLRALETRGDEDLTAVEPAVRAILDDVRARGDAAVLDACERFEKRRPSPLLKLVDGEPALHRLPREARAALELSARRIREFHEHQRDAGFRYRDGGAVLGTRVRPMKRAGVYAPGGKARYPSSVLMAAIPARVAGVRDVIVATPLAGDDSDDMILAAAHLAGVTRIVDAGGAQAIGAMAYGTASIPRVDVIVGPGNIYVACAKRLVSGLVKIDGIAGPSEILVVADRTADARVVAADLLSQAEHDEDAYPLLVTDDAALAEAVCREVEAQLATLPRHAIARASVERQGKALVVDGRAAMAEVADRVAAEHLALHVVDPDVLLDAIDAAGAAFIGASTPEAVGDYVAGPSHVLPTGGAVRFGSPLGVYDFVTRTSIVRYDETTLAAQADAICTFARLEGLEAHARAVEARTKR